MLISNFLFYFGICNYFELKGSIKLQPASYVIVFLRNFNTSKFIVVSKILFYICCRIVSQDNGVFQYYNQYNSTESFRYLGYQIIYTIQQRRFLEEQLLSNLKTVISIYSQRQLSLRGRATVMNTLILTKNWYLLRIFNPTLSFMRKIRQLMYQYVWQNKKTFSGF